MLPLLIAVIVTSILQHPPTIQQQPDPPELPLNQLPSSFQLLDRTLHVAKTKINIVCPVETATHIESIKTMEQNEDLRFEETDSEYKNPHFSLCSVLIGVSVNTGWIHTACSNAMSLLSPAHEIHADLNGRCKQCDI